jgi:hypothetical protein
MSTCVEMIMSARMGRGIGVVTVLLVLFAAGCGKKDDGPGVASAGGNPAATATASSAGEADQQEQLRQFAQCMRDHGVDLPDPQPGAGMAGISGWGTTLSADDPTVQAAFQACRSKLPNGGEIPKLNSQQMQIYLNFAACMRRQGIDLPDPAADGTLALGALLASGVNPDDPAFQAAFTACRDTLTGIIGGASLPANLGGTR